MQSDRLTFSLASLILIFAFAFVAMPALAHDGDDTHDALTDAHILVESVRVDKTTVKENDILTVTVEFAPSAVVPGTPPPSHATSIDTGPGTLVIEVRGEDGTFDTPTLTVPLTVQTTVTTLRAPVQATADVDGVGGIYRLIYVVSQEISGDGVSSDGDYKISVPDSNGITDASNTMGSAIVTVDTTPPVVSNIAFKAVAGNDYPQDDIWTEDFVVEFDATDATSGLGATSTFMLAASPEYLTFSPVTKVGSQRFSATAMLVDTATADTTAMDVTITATITDKAGNSSDDTADGSMATIMLKRSATDDDDDDDMDDADPPMATIMVDELPSIGNKGLFRVRVVFTDGDDTTIDHTDLSVMDSSTPARMVEVNPANMMGTEDDEGNPHPEPLSTTNRYDGVLEYDTRNQYTYPLVVTIDDDVEISNEGASASVGEAAEEPAEEDTRPVATVTGPADGDLLSGEFQILITFSEATTLTKEDIVITPVTAGHVTEGSISPSSGMSKTFTVRIQPYRGAESIAVTVDDTRFMPHAMNGSIMDSEPIGTVKSITGPADFDGTAPFVVEVAFAEELPAGSTLAAADLDVTGGTVTDTGRKVGSVTVYEVQITPTDTMDVEVGLSEAGMVKFDYGTDVEALTVMQAADAPTAGTLTAAYDKATATTTISEGAIAGNGFVELYYMDLPDLEYFFDIGGTITLDDGDTEDDKNSRTVVMSEILWGLDFGEKVLADQQKYQFIELYNTTANTINLAGWKLTFVPGNVRPAIDIDQVSNRGPGGWEVDTGDTGKSGRVAETFADDPESTLTPARIVSMYRNINYTHVEKEAAKETVNRGELVKGIPGGNAKGSWKNSEQRSTHRWILSTPGAKHINREPILTASAVAGSPFRINEIGNDVSGDNDWVELHNVSDAEASLKNYALSMVTAKGTDARLFHFHDQDWKVPAKGFIVISTRHPSLTDLATGKDLSIPDADELNKGLKHLYVVKSGWNLQDDGKFALILRNAHDKSGKAENLIDVVAARSGAFSDTNTSLWPLKLGGNPHENVIDGGDEVFSSGKVYQRNGGNGRGEKQFAVAGYTGIGYDVKAAKVVSNHGTPGYDNGANRDKMAALMGGVVTISEIMFDLGDARRNLPQWIELHNSSATEGVNLNGWKIHIENAATLNGDPETNTFNATITLGAKTILPNQTVLIASRTGNVRDPNHFPPTRVANLWTTKAHRDALEMTSSTDAVLSTRGFSITLSDKDGKAVDQAGNLDGNRRTRDEPAWMLPMSDAPDSRSSILRVYEDKVALDGTMMKSWILASDTILAFEVSHAYYGNADDVGSPGYREGGPLPVSLSKFRPERLKDTGEIVVRWATESELNNAGFNILRSEKRDSEFTKVHFEAGQGTTSERSVYEWKDTTAKPNVVYYYQIQDVSLDGDVTTLRTTHLRGNVTAAGKLTTTWGEIKALR